MFLNIIIGVVMVLAFIGIMVCAKKQYVNTFARPAAGGLLVLVIICAGVIYVNNAGHTDAGRLSENALKFEKSSTYILGKELAEIKPGARVLVITGKQNEKHQKNMIEGLKEGFGLDITDVKFEELSITIPPKMKAEMEQNSLDEFTIKEFSTAKDFNTLIKKHKNRNLIVTLIGLPEDMGGLRIWDEFEDNARKCSKLVLVGEGNINKMAPAIEAGLIIAIITHKPDAKYNDECPSSEMQDVFDMCYLLITRQNLQEIKTKYPSMFKRPEK